MKTERTRIQMSGSSPSPLFSFLYLSAPIFFCPLCLLAFGVCFAGILRGRGTARLGAAHGRRCVGVARLGGG
ncbi:hypothetical protein ES332_D10G200400v1 [Gossypium tomentosum]|uniref:Uncharacterized protein n=1 Tax=Gossypium tomentosum TaxID=34277 RepID=A0A5D2J7Q4_GOSTO|nr:hypothetical protein ES332_D10G200400v1 [Gossypium tomentosum]